MAKPSLAAVALIALAFPAGASAFALESARVTPGRAFFDGREPIEATFRFSHGEPADVTVTVQRGTKMVRTIELKRLAPGQDHTVTWNGLNQARKPAADGKYRIRIGPGGGGYGVAESVFLRWYRYPVLGPHGFRGAVGEFRAARNGGRWHHGFDLVARCGTPLVAVRGGTVIRNTFDGALDGHYVIIRGRKENRTYRYSHLPTRSQLDVGDRVKTGDRVGVVGKSGNAASVGCHLHFEVTRKGRFIDPEPLLRAWDAYS
jgi:murein DD-endopeptidase MepM/ murein hydrolase activator NlpD